jgi:hypothetical protein
MARLDSPEAARLLVEAERAKEEKAREEGGAFVLGMVENAREGKEFTIETADDITGGDS